MVLHVHGHSFRLDRALRTLVDHVVLYDRLWRFRYVNDGAMAFFRRPRGELLGRCVWEVLPDLVGTEYFSNLHGAVAEQRAMTLERRVEALGIWLEEHIYPSADGVMVLAIDITTRKAAEHAQKESLRRLEQSIALAAHEIKGPLAPIKSGIAILRAMSDGTPTTRRAIEMLERQTQHIVRLVDDLLDASRVTQDRIELRRAPFCMSQLVSLALEEMLDLIERCGITLSFTPCAEPLTVDVDAMRISQVMRNVVTNACKYTNPGGRIDVRTYTVNGRAVVEVEDDGIGIPAENLESIFDMFSQVPEHRFRSREGLGVGLALARAVLRLHGGTISAFSPGAGLGSRFTITVPLLDLTTVAAVSHQMSSCASCAEPE